MQEFVFPGVLSGSATTVYTPANLNQYSQAGTDPVTNGNEHELAKYQNVNYAYINTKNIS